MKVTASLVIMYKIDQRCPIDYSYITPSVNPQLTRSGLSLNFRKTF